MNYRRDRRFDWVAALAVLAGIAVLVPSLSALGVTLISVLKAIL